MRQIIQSEKKRTLFQQMLWHSSKAQGYFFHYSCEEHRVDSVFCFFTLSNKRTNSKLVTSLKSVEEQSLTKLCLSRSMQLTDYRRKEGQKDFKNEKKGENRRSKLTMKFFFYWWSLRKKFKKSLKGSESIHVTRGECYTSSSWKCESQFHIINYHPNPD